MSKGKNAIRDKKGAPAKAESLSVKTKRGIASARNATRPGSSYTASNNPNADFNRQKRAFERIPQAKLEAYSGSYVASVSGVIVDSDVDLPRLTGRFFAARGHIPVYMGFVGQRTLVIETPF
jgi:hypothetical protein